MQTTISPDAGELRELLARLYAAVNPTGTCSMRHANRIRQTAARIARLTGLTYSQVIDQAVEDAANLLDPTVR